MTVILYSEIKTKSTPQNQNQKKTLATDIYSYSIIPFRQKKPWQLQNQGYTHRLPLEPRGPGKEVNSPSLGIKRLSGKESIVWHHTTMARLCARWWGRKRTAGGI